MYIDRTCREYRAGFYAYTGGLHIRENPYLRTNSERKWDHWQRGWLNAQQARADGRRALPVNQSRGAGRLRVVTDALPLR